jgi:hypothetical protein
MNDPNTSTGRLTRRPKRLPDIERPRDRAENPRATRTSLRARRRNPRALRG